METIRTANRIHPLMAAAAVSVVIVSLAATAAITGVLPTSRGANAPELSALAPAQAPMALAAAPMAAPAPLAYQQDPVAYPQAPVYQQAPAVKHVAPRAHHTVHHYSRVARNDGQNYSQPAPQAAARQPNYLGIGAGALVGGLLGHQVGGGNGNKLATVAGVIGGGFLGNEIANRNR